MSPLTSTDGDDFPWLIDELVPGIAAQGDDLFLGLEDSVGKPVVTHELPDVFRRVEFRRSGRQRQKGDVGRDRCCPGSILSGTELGSLAPFGRQDRRR